MKDSRTGEITSLAELEKMLVARVEAQVNRRPGGRRGAQGSCRTPLPCRPPPPRLMYRCRAETRPVSPVSFNRDASSSVPVGREGCREGGIAPAARHSRSRSFQPLPLDAMAVPVAFLFGESSVDHQFPGQQAPLVSWTSTVAAVERSPRERSGHRSGDRPVSGRCQGVVGGKRPQGSVFLRLVAHCPQEHLRCPLPLTAGTAAAQEMIVLDQDSNRLLSLAELQDLLVPPKPEEKKKRRSPSRAPFPQLSHPLCSPPPPPPPLPSCFRTPPSPRPAMMGLFPPSKQGRQSRTFTPSVRSRLMLPPPRPPVSIGHTKLPWRCLRIPPSRPSRSHPASLSAGKCFD